VLSVEDKVNVIKEIESGKKKADVYFKWGSWSHWDCKSIIWSQLEYTKIISEIMEIEDDLEKQYWSKRKQKKITDLFV
jgi:hypothetical protein